MGENGGLAVEVVTALIDADEGAEAFLVGLAGREFFGCAGR